MLQNNSQAAIEVFRQVVEAEPLDLSSISTLGDLYVRTGQIPEAVGQFSKLADAYLAEGVPRKAIAVLKKIMSIDPANTGTWIKLADLYATAGLPGEARQHYLQIADAYNRNGRMNEAIEVFAKVVALDPSNASARIKLGELCRREGLNDQAYEAFITAARQLTTRGETRRAINAYNEALSIRPDSPDALAAIRASASGRTLGIQKLVPAAPVGNSIVDAALSSGNLDGPPAKAPPPNARDERETALVIQEISQAEILVAYGQVNQAIAKLKAVASKLPDNVDVRGKLKDIYLRNGMTAEGAAECRELERIYTALGDDARARDYSVRASRLTQLVEPSSGDLRPPKPEPTVESEPLTDVSFDNPHLNSNESIANALGDTSPRRNPEPLAAVVSKPVVRVAAPLEESPKPVPPLKLIPIEDAQPFRASVIDAAAESLVAVPREQFQQTTSAATGESVDTSLVRVLPGSFSDPRSATRKPGRIKALAIAASVVAVLGAGGVIGRFVFDARLTKQHQELAMASPPVTPAAEPDVATSPAETLRGAEPITVVVDAAEKKPLPSASQPEDRARVEKAMPNPEPPIVEAPKPISKPTAPSPSPPRVSVNPDNHGSANAVPAGVPVEPPQGPVPSAPPPRPVHVTQGVVMGGAIKRVEPVYPANAREAKQFGVVRVEVSIDEGGNVASVRVLSGPPLLRGAALAAARSWRFKPSTIGGTPVKTTTVIDFNFKL
jgi:protein TonB